MTRQKLIEDEGLGEITPKTLLRRFDIYNQIIEKLRSQNLETGLDVKRNNDFVPQTHLIQQTQYEKFVKSISHPRSGKWNTIQNLQEADILSDDDIERFETPLPYARLNRLTRVKYRNGKEFLERMFTMWGLTREGNVIHKVFVNCDFYHMPVVVREFVPVDVDNKEGKRINVRVTPSSGMRWGLEPQGEKVNLIEYSEDKVHQILKEIPPAGDFTDLYHGCTLTLVNTGETNDTMAVKTLEEFIQPFDVVWSKYRKPPNVDLNSLVKELQKRSNAESEKLEHIQ